ncbi:Flagellar biosynthetic protein FlhB [Gammaproteobacteria bacterium]
MSEESDQERTEAATPRRLEEARERGQVPRSRELNTLVVTLTGAIALLIYGKQFVAALADLMRRGFSLTRGQAHDSLWLTRMFSELSLTALQDFTPLLILLVIAALVSPLALGGWSFSTEALGFKFERLNPIEGLKRLFSWQGLAELGKALIKFILIAWVGIWLLRRHFAELSNLGQGDLLVGIARLGEVLAWAFLFLAAVLVVIVAADIPFQLWEHSHGLKMTRQEVRDEVKESEGRPEVKGRIRQMQREMSKRRMMAEVPKADVVITNPTHYAVALCYDSTKMGAPRVIAKGVDFLAIRIREIAKQAGVPLIAAPALARSLYHNVELDKEIPDGLFQAVAQILAFVYQLRKTGIAPKTNTFDNLPIPEELRH